MSKQIKVAVIEVVGGHGGMDLFDFSLCRGLLKAGNRVSLFTCDETTDPHIPGLRFYTSFRNIFGKASVWMRSLRYLSAVLRTFWIVVKGGNDICHLHFYHGDSSELVLVVMAKLCGRKVVLTVHDVSSFGKKSNQFIKSKVYRMVDRLTVHNQVSRRELSAAVGVPEKDISVIPHGNYAEFMLGSDQLEAKRRLALETGDKTVLFFGHIKQVKGLDLLIEAMPAVIQAVPDAKFVISGRPWRDDFTHYDQQIEALGVRDSCVIRLGYSSIEDAMAYYSAADLVVLPYRRIYQSGVLLMAMTCGKPVLVSNLEGMTEIVRDRENGYVFEQGSSDDLSRVLIHALNNPDERNQLATKGHEFIHSFHDWTRICESLTDVYRQILGISKMETEATSS